uniref:Adhesion G-protein coupled receptor G2 n=1 Tax=Geotrypetes seraphini TaxID=260995 RepID=A0A6P8R7K5_GEOSA|nr:adhesion G-protein coupled receptor G2 [Geotrypetes seraphini]XP_033805807.1 adhesion G-protein coupled receptor G2 [Geotrypetes seraphini]
MPSFGLQHCCVGKIKRLFMAFKSSGVLLLFFVLSVPLKAQGQFLGDYKAVFETPCKESMTTSSKLKVPRLEDFTVCVHLKLTSDGPWTAFTYKQRATDSSGEDSYDLGLAGDSGNLIIWIFGNQITVPGILSLHTWYQTCIIWESHKKNMVFYINGKAEINKRLKGKPSLAVDGLLSLGCSQYPSMSSFASAVGLTGELYLFRMWNGKKFDFDDCVDGDVIGWDMADWVFDNSTLKKDNSLQCATRNDPHPSTTAAPNTAVVNLLDISSVVDVLTNLGIHKKKNGSAHDGTDSIIKANSSDVIARFASLAVSSPVSISASTTSPHMNKTGNFSCPVPGSDGFSPTNNNLCNISTHCGDSALYYVSMKLEYLKGKNFSAAINALNQLLNKSGISMIPPQCLALINPSTAGHSTFMSQGVCIESDGSTINFTDLMRLKIGTDVCKIIADIENQFRLISRPNITSIDHCCCSTFTACPSKLEDLNKYFCYKRGKQMTCEPMGTTPSMTSPRMPSSNVSSSNYESIPTTSAPPSSGTSNNYESTPTTSISPSNGTSSNYASTPTTSTSPSPSNGTSSNSSSTPTTSAPPSNGTSSNYESTPTTSTSPSNGTSSNSSSTPTTSTPPSNGTSSNYESTPTTSTSPSNGTSSNSSSTPTTSAPPSNGTSSNYESTPTMSTSPSNSTSSNNSSTPTTSAPPSNGTSSNYESTPTTSTSPSNGTSSNSSSTPTTSAPPSNGTSSNYESTPTTSTSPSNGTSSNYESTPTTSAPPSNGTSSNYENTPTTSAPPSNDTSSNNASTPTTFAPPSSSTSSNNANTPTTLAPPSNGTSTEHPTASTTPVPGSSGGILNDINSLLNSSHLNGTVVDKMVAQMEQILSGNEPVDPELAGTFVDVVNNFMNISSDLLAPVANRLINIVDAVGLRMDFPSESVNLTASSLALAVTKVNATSFKQISFAIEQTSDLQVSLGSGENNRSSAAVTLPSSLLADLSPEDKNLASRIQFNFFAKTTLFKSGSEWNKSLISSVISSSVANLTLTHLKENVTVILKTNRHPNQEKNAVHCVFWNFSADGGRGDWSSEGCTVASSRIDQTVCKCNHLTSFGVLLDLSRNSNSIPPEHVLILTFITYIGCGLSAIFLSVTLVTYIAFEKIRRDYPSKILIQLCAALLMLNLVFLVDSWIALYNDIPGLCISVAVFLHYFLLASFTWMGLEAFHMYLALVKVFNTYVRRYILKFCIVGWGLPAIIVAIIVAINRQFYGRGSYGKFPGGSSDEFCWINNNIVFYITVVGYFCLIFLVNISMFIVVLIQLFRIKKKKQLGGQRKNSLQDLRSVAGLTFLLGTTWGFAFFAWGPVNLPFMYLFAIFNTLQGFFIFIFYCLGKENVRKQWRRHLCCGKFRLAENSDWSRTATNGLRKQALKQGMSNSSNTSIQSTCNGNSTGSTNSSTRLVNNDYFTHQNGNGPFFAERNNITFNLQNNGSRFQNLPDHQLCEEEEDVSRRRTQPSVRRTSNKGNIHFSDQI